MGHGIAQVCAQTGYDVKVHDIEDNLVQAGLDKIRKFLEGGVERKKMTIKEADATLSRIKGTTDLQEAARDADLVIEAIIENLEIKKNTYKKLDTICLAHTVFASNTSYQSITEMAAVTKRPDKFLGMHWFNPPQIMRGIEVIRGEKTSQGTLDTIVELCKKLGKEPAVCKDSPGFIINRILQPWHNEGLKMLDEGVASFQDIDIAYKVGYNFRMGPFEFLDLVGIDLVAVGNEFFYNEFKSDMSKLSQCHRMKIRAGDFGRKTGRGFYEYERK